MKTPALLLSSLLFISIAGCINFESDNTPEVKNIFKITDTTFYGTLWSKIYNKYHIISQDGGNEFKVPGGSIWCFGDTFKGTRSKSGKPHFKGGGVNTSIAFLPDGSTPYPPQLQFLTGKDGTVTFPFKFSGKETPKKNSIWPLAGIYLNGKSYLYYTMIKKTGTNSCWDFQPIGDGLAVSDKPLGHYRRIIKNNTWKFPVRPASIIKTKKWLYLYSIENTGRQMQGVFLARIKPQDIENPEKYEYYCKNNNFSKNIKDKKIMLNAIYGQVSVAWNTYLNKYILAASSNLMESRLIRFFISNSPSGPWFSTNAKIQIPKIRQSKKVELVYCAFLHPELFRKNGKIIFLTYSLLLKNSTFDTNCEMVRIEIEKGELSSPNSYTNR